MAATPDRSERAQGFAPDELSALVNLPVIRQHAAESAFLWSQRHKAMVAPHYKLKHLAKLDARLQGHLRGLQVAGAAGFELARALLGDLEPGAMFVVAFLAFGGRNAPQMYQALKLGLSEPPLEEELLAALAWLDPSTLETTLGRLCASPVSAYRRIGLAALLAHRLDMDAEIERGVLDEDPKLRALAFRAIGDAKLSRLRVTAERGLRDPDPTCRFWAGWSLAIHGDEAAAVAAYDVGESIISLRRAALEMAVRCGERNWSRGIVRALAGAPDKRRDAIRAVGMFGDPGTIPWLLEQFKDPAHSRLAGEALTTITGVDLRFSDLAGDASAVEESDSEDSDLPWPEVPAVREWWNRHSAEFQDAPRYLWGQPVSAAGALHVLKAGYQRQRWMAAFELAIQTEAAVFPVGARADWQRLWLAT